jgi:hypothetical protein
VHDVKDTKTVSNMQTEDIKSKQRSAHAAESKNRSLWSIMSLRRSAPDVSAEAGSDSNTSGQSEVSVPFSGQLSEVAVFMEPLLDTHIQAIHSLGM